MNRKNCQKIDIADTNSNKRPYEIPNYAFRGNNQNRRGAELMDRDRHLKEARL